MMSSLLPFPKSVLMADNVPWVEGDVLERVYGPEGLAQIHASSDLIPERITAANFGEHAGKLATVEVIFSTWGMPVLSAAQVAAMPRLKAVFYAAGSVKAFAGELFKRNITVCSAAHANAIPVAEFCLGQILLSCKGAFRNAVLCKKGPWTPGALPVGPGNYGSTVALIGVGLVGGHLLKLLKSVTELKVLGVSDCLTDEQARNLGIDRLVDIETAFREALVVSNHLPDLPSLRGVFTHRHFASMRPGATFINSGRGAQVDEDALVAVLRERPDLTALLDVQHPEPPPASSPLYSLPNVQLTSHISGSSNDEVRRMGKLVLDEYDAWREGRPLLHRVAPETLANKA